MLSEVWLRLLVRGVAGSELRGRIGLPWWLWCCPAGWLRVVLVPASRLLLHAALGFGGGEVV